MLQDIPEVFEGMVEVDETYLGGQKKNKRKSQLLKEKQKVKSQKEVLVPVNNLSLASDVDLARFGQS